MSIEKPDEPLNIHTGSPSTGMYFGREIHVYKAGQGKVWFNEGWRLFRHTPMLWIACTLIQVVLVQLVGHLPVVGSIASLLVQGVLVAGMFSFAHAVATAEKPGVARLFDGFRHKFGDLVMLGVLEMLMFILAIVLCIAITVAAAWASDSADLFSHWISTSQMPPEMASSLALLSGAAVLLTLFIFLFLVIVMAFWLAPPLVFFSELLPKAAVKISFISISRNWLSLTVFSLLWAGLALLVCIPGGIVFMLLGLPAPGSGYMALALAVIYFLVFLVFLSASAASTYAAFRDIFSQHD